MSRSDIDLSEVPEINEEQMERAILRIGGKPVARGKVRVNLVPNADDDDTLQSTSESVETRSTDA